MLLKNNSVGELLLTNGTRVLHLHWEIFSVNANVSLQVSFGGESPAAHFAFKGSFACVDAIVHLERALTAEDTVTEDTLVGICNLFVNILHQLLKL